LDGGSSVAADSQGHVYVAWHAFGPGASNELGRALFVSRSNDEGKTFQRETPASPKPTGACACCGMKAFADSQGAVYMLYRAALAKVDRDEVLLVSPRPGAPFEIAHTAPWKTPNCPMSSATLSEAKEGAVATWETAGQVYFATVNPKTMQVSTPIAAPGAGKRKHPAAVTNAKGETLFVWTEGTGWAKGGAMAWQLYDNQGKATADKGRAEGLPVWSLATALAKPDGRFVVIY
jgi:hypothetical protein